MACTAVTFETFFSFLYRNFRSSLFHSSLHSTLWPFLKKLGLKKESRNPFERIQKMNPRLIERWSPGKTIAYNCELSGFLKAKFSGARVDDSRRAVFNRPASINHRSSSFFTLPLIFSLALRRFLPYLSLRHLWIFMRKKMYHANEATRLRLGTGAPPPQLSIKSYRSFSEAGVGRRRLFTVQLYRKNTERRFPEDGKFLAPRLFIFLSLKKKR